MEKENTSVDMFGLPVRVGDEIVRGARNAGLRRHFVVAIAPNGQIGTAKEAHYKKANAWVSPSELICIEGLKKLNPSLFI